MVNRKYYSFERNNYYYGKMLTSRDFQNEQSYMNDKRRLVNRLLHGVGIVYGMDVIEADDSSIVLQSGLALDAAGREIVVPRTQVIKLSTIEGYADLQTEHAFLGIAYAEEDTDPVYAVMNEGTGEEGRQYNRKKEQYRLFLCDRKDCIRNEERLDTYLKTQILYQDEDICVTQEVPAFLVPGVALKSRIRIEKISHMPGVYSFSCQMGAEGLVPGTCEVHADNVSQEYGDVYVIEKAFRPEDYIFGNEGVNLRVEQIRVTTPTGQESAEDMAFSVAAVQGTVLEHVRKTSTRGTLDVDLDRTYDEKLWIASIHLIRSAQHSMIDQVRQAPFDQYVSSAEELMILEQLHEYLVPEQEMGYQTVSQTEIPVTGEKETAQTDRRIHSSGVFEMSLGNGGESGKSYFSDEIMHGLGNGPVCVEIGIEYISRDNLIQGDRESIILGDGSIFAEDTTVTDDKILSVDQAIKILPDRGTFIVGIRPKVKIGKMGIRIRWYAYKPEDLEQRVYNQKEQKGCIMIQPDTMVLPPKGSIHMKPVFINMKETALSYTLLDPEGGKIDNNGVYTAPAQEGVYEVKVEAIGEPEIFTHAFVIVSQKKADE